MVIVVNVAVAWGVGVASSAGGTASALDLRVLNEGVGSAKTRLMFRSDTGVVTRAVKSPFRSSQYAFAQYGAQSGSVPSTVAGGATMAMETRIARTLEIIAESLPCS